MEGDYAGLSHEELLRLREREGSLQELLAPLEHQAFAREWMRANPVSAGVSLPVAIPAYQLAKLLKLVGSRTPASLDQLFGGYTGMVEGMRR